MQRGFLGSMLALSLVGAVACGGDDAHHSSTQDPGTADEGAQNGDGDGKRVDGGSSSTGAGNGNGAGNGSGNGSSDDNNGDESDDGGVDHEERGDGGVRGHGRHDGGFPGFEFDASVFQRPDGGRGFPGHRDAGPVTPPHQTDAGHTRPTRDGGPRLP